MLLEALLKEGRPISQRACHHSRMDEIEFVAEGPWLFNIVDFERHIWWDTVLHSVRQEIIITSCASVQLWLNRAQVNSQDLGLWIFIRKVDGPDTRASPNV